MTNLNLRNFICFLLMFMSFTDPAGCVKKDLDALPDITSLCPHRQFCNRPLAKNISKESKDSCCQACSCGLDCHVLGSCCPDVQHAALGLPTYPCKDIDKLLNSVRNVSWRIPDDRMYRIIDDCPDENSSMYFPACMQPAKLQDFVIVSDRANQKVFKNSDCSLCHGTADFIEWDLKTECTDVPFTDFKTFQQRDEYILENCMLTAHPPNKVIDDIARCYDRQSMIQDCQGRQDLTEYDKLLKAECFKENLLQNTVYFVDDLYRRRVYKNVYCYLCSRSKHVKMTDICNARAYDTGVKLHGLISFSGVLTMSRQESPYQNDFPSICQSEDMWDPFVRQCRELFCPIGRIPVYGRCLSSMKSAFGLSLTIRFEVILKEISQLTDRDVVLLIDSKFPVLFSSNFKCGQCSLIFYKDASGKKLYFEISVFTNEVCSLDNLLLGLREVVKTKKRALSVEFKGKVRHLVIKNVPDDILNKTYLPIATLRNPNQCVDAMQTDLYILQNCPNFKISNTVFQKIVRSDMSVFNNLKDELLAIKNDKRKTVFICVEEYFRLATQASCSQDFPLFDMIVNYLVLQFVSRLL